MRLASQHGAINRAIKRPLLRPNPTYLGCTTTSRSLQQYVDQVQLKENPNSRAKNIAVLGGGITGLTTAFHLQRSIPHAHITIYEKNSGLGGWLNSEVIEVDGGEVLFEWGARSLRPDVNGAGLATLALLIQLEIAEKALGIDKRSPAATNRYIYYPDHLVRLPGPSASRSRIVSMFQGLYTVLTEPIFKGVLSAFVSEPAVAVRPSGIADESVGSFVKRRFGTQVADNLFSAVLHGIYAGDLYKLSARTLLPLLWYAETRDPNGNGLIAEFADLIFKGQSLQNYKDVHFRNLVVAAKDIPSNNPAIDLFLHAMRSNISVYTFISGVAFLGEKLKEALTASERVKFNTGKNVSSLVFDAEKNEIAVGTSSNSNDEKSQYYDYVVSTLSPGQMKSIVAEGNKSSVTDPVIQGALTKANAAVNVMVVNLYYSNPDLIPATHSGFGYLIPRSISLDQNPERALGVIFGSETSGPRGEEAMVKVEKPSQDTLDEMKKGLDMAKTAIDDDSLSQDIRDQNKFSIDIMQGGYDVASKMAEGPDQLRFGQDTAPGTKLTVMMGGHWWDGWNDSDLPTEDEAVEMAKAVIARQLKIVEAPSVAKARLNRNCIPQYHVGYRDTMATIHKGFKDAFQGRLKVAGPWWQGAVGVNDCTRKARLAAFSIREGWDDTTGLEEYDENEKWILFDRKLSKAVIDPMQS